MYGSNSKTPGYTDRRTQIDRTILTSNKPGCTDRIQKIPDIRIEFKETRRYGSTLQNPDIRIELKEPGYTNEPGYTVRTERINFKKIPFSREPRYHFL